MSTCLCDRLPADFTVGIGHHPRCPQAHRPDLPGGTSLVEKRCRTCGLTTRHHAKESSDE